MNAIVPRKTVEEVVAARNETLRLYQTAFNQIQSADTALKDARLMWKAASPSFAGRYYDAGAEAQSFFNVVRMPDRDTYLATARRLVDITVWQHVVEISGIEDLMDRTEKEKLRSQMAYRPPKFSTASDFLDELKSCIDYTHKHGAQCRRMFDPFRGIRSFKNHIQTLQDDPETVMALGTEGIEAAKGLAKQLIAAATANQTGCNSLQDLTTSLEDLQAILDNPPGLPPVTVENIMATLNGLLGQSNEIFLRGVASSFSALDRRFKSHDGFKVGSRIIIDRLCDDCGMVSYGRQEDIFADVERIFKLLDGGKPGAMYGSILHTIRQRPFGPHQSEHESDFFKVRIFKNGNAHLWFTRKDLVRKVNRCLADYYGEVIGDGQQAGADPLKDRKTTPAKRFGFFPTPDAAAETVIAKANLRGDTALRVLEPSAGTGQLASRAAGKGHIVDCVEIQPHLVELLRRDGRYNTIMEADFFGLGAAPIYDRIVMNPPFDRERDIDHVLHALKFLKPDGFLIAIMSTGTTVRETKKSAAFRKMVKTMGGDFTDLPERSFAESGTNVNTCYLRVWNNGTKVNRWS